MTTTKKTKWVVGTKGVERDAEGNITKRNDALEYCDMTNNFGLGAIAHSFVKRHTPESGFSHCEESWDDICAMVEKQLMAGEWECGYAPGIYIVDLYTGDSKPGGTYVASDMLEAQPRPDTLFPVWCPVVDLTIAKDIFPDMKLVANYESRVEGEDPRKSITVKGTNGKQRASAAWAIVYHSDVLKKNDQNEGEGQFEIVSINSSLDGRFEPIHPETMMHNQFGSDGGSDTQMDPEEFMGQLERSFKYWKNKVMIASIDLEEHQK